MRPTGPDVDAYLAALPESQRAALERLRRAILAAAPGAEECISYGIPAIRLAGRVLVYYGAAAKHCSFYPGAHPIEVCAAQLVPWSTSKGTIRFTPDKPLPLPLVRKLVKVRIAELVVGKRRGGAGRKG
ncbi:MAG: DUF1801 domain-containing protein [Holophagales bacterium]|nr:MAG: DUF1801 domain-containing protein [Holophagales bacterium]